MTTLAVAGNESSSAQARAWDWDTGAREWNSSGGGTPGTDANPCVVDPQGNSYIFDINRGRIHKYDNLGVEVWTVTPSLTQDDGVRAIATDGTLVVVADRGGNILVRDASDGSAEDSFSVGLDDPRCVDLDADGWMTIGMDDGHVRRSEPDGFGSWDEVWTVQPDSDTVTDLGVTAPGPSGDVFCGGIGTTIYKLSGTDGSVLGSDSGTGSGTGSRIHALDVDDRGFVVMTTRASGQVAYTDDLTERWHVTPNADRGFGVAATPDRDWLVTWGNSIPEGGMTIARLADADGSTVWDDDLDRMGGCGVMPGRLASFPAAWTDEESDPANLAVTIDGTTAQLSWDASPMLT